MSIHIRAATANDEPALAVLNASVQKLHADAEPAIFKQPMDGVFTPKPVAEILADTNNSIWIALVDDTPAGYLWATIIDRPENVTSYAQRRLHIEHLAVLPDFQRHGVGAALMAQARELARTIHATQMTLNSWTFNTKAHHFFESQGFEPYHIGFRAALS